VRDYKNLEPKNAGEQGAGEGAAESNVSAGIKRRTIKNLRVRFESDGEAVAAFIRYVARAMSASVAAILGYRERFEVNEATKWWTGSK
jgi:hypothetical protein